MKLMCLVPPDKGPRLQILWGYEIPPDVKELFDKPPEVKKRRCRYVIYK
jgi:hypothetical protein